ncbi:MAG: energy transducer TonB [Candidatus Acidiferrales bacterium]
MKTKLPRSPALVERVPEKIATRRIAFLACVILAFDFVCSSAFAQQQELDSLVSKTAKALTKAHVSSVVVADFVGPGEQFTMLGQELADEFSAELVKNTQGWTVLTREKFGEYAKGTELLPNDLHDAEGACAATSAMSVDSIILGHVDFDGSKIRVKVNLYTARDKCEERSKTSIKLPLNEQEREFASKTVSFVPAIPFDVPTADTKGYGIPQCAYCPAPPFSGEAVRAKYQGTVSLRVVVMPDGRAHNIQVVKGLGLGLDEKAIEAVKRWRFKPANGPDGKPAAVVTMIEVTFRLI